MKHALSGVLRGFPADALHVWCHAACRRTSARAGVAVPMAGRLLVTIRGLGLHVNSRRTHRVTSAALTPSARIERAVTTPPERVSGSATIRRRRTLTSGSWSPCLRYREAGKNVAVVDGVGAVSEPVAAPQSGALAAARGNAAAGGSGLRVSGWSAAAFPHPPSNGRVEALAPASGSADTSPGRRGPRLVDGVSLQRPLVDVPPQDL